MGARPLLETLSTGAQSRSPKAERRGGCGDRRMSLLLSLRASPHVCEVLQPARSFRGTLGALRAQTNAEQVTDTQSGGLDLPAASRTHCPSPPVGLFIKNLHGWFSPQMGAIPWLPPPLFFKSKIALIPLPVGACPCISCALPQRSPCVDLLHSPCETRSPLCLGQPLRLPPAPCRGRAGLPCPALYPPPRCRGG